MTAVGEAAGLSECDRCIAAELHLQLHAGLGRHTGRLAAEHFRPTRLVDGRHLRVHEPLALALSDAAAAEKPSQLQLEEVELRGCDGACAARREADGVQKAATIGEMADSEGVPVTSEVAADEGANEGERAAGRADEGRQVQQLINAAADVDADSDEGGRQTGG